VDALLSYCGLECSSCPAFIARRDNDNELREKTAREWSEQFHAEFIPDSIDCDGCVVEGVHSPYCSMCEIRECATAKGVTTCAHCKDYGCEKLAKVHAMDEQCKARLDEIRTGL
jgi:hypothetical protein